MKLAQFRTCTHRACILTISLVLGVVTASLGADEPLWKQGISTWNGSSYDELLDEPPAVTTNLSAPLPVAEQEFAAPLEQEEHPALEQTPRSSSLGSKPYTIPVDPNSWTPQTVGTIALPASLPIGQSAVGLDPPVNGKVATATEGEAVQALPPPVGDAGPDDIEPDSDLNEADLSAAGPIGEAIEAGDGVVESAPLEPAVVRWYQYPQQWMRGWDSHAEFGIDGSDGNATTLAIQTGLEMKRKTDRYTLALDVDYRQASNRKTTVEDNGRFNLDYDRIMGDSPWSGFGKFGLEWDKFKAFDLRVNLNGGLGYHWIRTDQTSLVTRFGAGANQEIGAPNDDWIAEAVFGIEAEKQLTARQKIKGKVDYFPAWEDFGNFRLVTDLAWEILLDGSENLSLKLAATDRYDSTPQGAEHNDIYYSLLLLYKF